MDLFTPIPLLLSLAGLATGLVVLGIGALRSFRSARP